MSERLLPGRQRVADRSPQLAGPDGRASSGCGAQRPGPVPAAEDAGARPIRRLLVVNINPAAGTLDGCRAIARGFQAVAPGLEVVIRHWRALTPRVVGRLRPLGVVLGPNGTPFPAYPPAFDRFLAWVRARRGPTLGICGGHQALALAHGAPVGPVFRVPAATVSYAGMPKVAGESRVRLLGDPDPLLAGLPGEVVVASSHVDEVKEVPPGFRLLAIGDPCHIQVLRADRRPLWGVQFHPERPAGAGDEAGAGARILANFLEICRGGAPGAIAPGTVSDPGVDPKPRQG